MGSSFGKLYSYKDPFIAREFDQIYKLLQQGQLDERNLDIENLAKQIAPLIPEGALTNIERFFEGQRIAKFLSMYNTDDESFPTVRLVKHNSSREILLLVGGPGEGHTGHFILASNNARLTQAGVWESGTSQRKSKRGFRKLDGEQVLRALRKLPIETWEYKAEPGIRRAGPMAEDWRRLFGLGVKHTVYPGDLAAIAIRGVQSLLDRVESLERQLRARPRRRKKKRT